jgi:transposase
MKRFVEGEDRRQATLLPEYLDDSMAPDDPVRVIETFIDELDLVGMGFSGVVPEPTGRPAYHPQPCSRSICTAISTASHQAGGSNERASATLS